MRTNAGDLPHILIVDDQFRTDSPERQQILDRLAILDSRRAIDREYLAQADICTAVFNGEFSESALQDELHALQKTLKWDLVLVDYHFYSLGRKQDEIGAKRVVEFLRKKGYADKNAFILFTRGEADEQKRKNALCNGYLRKPTGNLTEEEVGARRRAFGKLLFENGFTTDGPVCYVDRAGKIINKGDDASFFGDTPATRELLRLARQALLKWLKTGSPILIEGRSGDGKTELGRYLHRWSEAALAYALEPADLSGLPQHREFRVISSGEIGAAFLGALLLHGEFATLNDLWRRMARDTIVLHEIAYFDSQTLMGLLRHASEDLQSRFRLHLFTTSQTHRDLVETGRIPPEFFSNISIGLHLPRLGLRGDWEAIFLRELDKGRQGSGVVGSNTLSPEARKTLGKKAYYDDALTFRQLKAMAHLEAKWQADHEGIKNFQVVEDDRLRVWYSQTEGLVQPELGLSLVLKRLERYQLTPSDNVKDGLTQLRLAMKRLFLQMLDAAYSTCSENRLEAGRYLGGEIEAGNDLIDFLKPWFTFLGIEHDNVLYKRILGPSPRARLPKRK